LSFVDFRLCQDGDNALSSLFDLDLLIKDQQLVIELSYSNRVMADQAVSQLQAAFKQSIETVVATCLAQSGVSYTVSDFKAADLDPDDVNALFE
jgi:non-ribosomal peptide synthase protein (TIGR01720 family)